MVFNCPIDAARVNDGGNVNTPKQLKGWILYLALVAAAFFAHACAVELDEQSATTAATARQV
ncbi:conserved hypothetical protein [Cupriavidus necator]|uniref:Uncharacterized protein n=1 Tax=Cupriavidus necator TaxID=106590 RepID=A0A1K0J3E5_CUPNE|nr:conserved hypothetical protein [Cupriavidus necator]